MGNEGHETEPPSPGGDETADTVEREYREALGRVAGEVNLSPDEFSRRVDATAEQIVLTPECLTLADVERFPSFTSLPEHRQRHVRRCPTCLDLIAVIEPRPDELEIFLRKAVPVSTPETVARFYGVPELEWGPLLKGGAVGLVLASLIGFPLFRSMRSEERTLRAAVQTFTSGYVLAVPEEPLLLARDLSIVPGSGIDPVDAAAQKVLQTSPSFDGPKLSFIVNTEVLQHVPQTETLTAELSAAKPVDAESLRNLSRIFLATAHQACARGPAGSDAAVRLGFAALRKTGVDEGTWGRDYARLVERIEGYRIQPAAAADGPPMALCDGYLKKSAEVRWWVMANTPAVPRHASDRSLVSVGQASKLVTAGMSLTAHRLTPEVLHEQ